MQLFQSLWKKFKQGGSPCTYTTEQHSHLATSRWSWLLFSDLRVSKLFQQTTGRFAPGKTPSTTPNHTPLPHPTVRRPAADIPWEQGWHWIVPSSAVLLTPPPLTSAERTLPTHGCFQPAMTITPSVAREHPKN